ncbi:hypothetical protein BT96DRAFT_836147, partial [Gymnopus androsaceus JB14]
PYMNLLCVMENLYHAALSAQPICSCHRRRPLLVVLIFSLAELEQMTVDVCSYRHAPTQLVQQGLFPCAPVLSNMAVDIQVLNFVTQLFLRVAPNNTAASGTMEAFLELRGY